MTHLRSLLRPGLLQEVQEMSLQLTWRNTILVGDVREQLATLPDESVHCVVTSPPYWGLRDYGVDGQIGLEATPDAFVCALVDVFREVRRVLRSDGTAWVNLGDSYAGSGKGPSNSIQPLAELRGQRHAGQYANGQAPTEWISIPRGLKPKDLVGIPWAVAKALQAPYYTGRIRDERERVWLAAMIDGEGCMFLHKRKIGQNNGQGYARKSDTYGAGLEIANTSEAIIQRCLAITGRGSIVRQEKDRRQPLFRWNLRSNECREVIKEVYPYLVGKQHQARLILGCPSSGPQAEAAHAGCIALHNGQECAIDFPPPASLYEPGWWLRSDVIWSKSNPMPESVTDRPTKAHEYLFLLTKSERYFYDAEAIKETSTTGDARRPYTSVGTWEMDGRALEKRHGGEARQTDATNRNRRTVWEIATQPYAEAHFATFPEELVKPCIQAGTSEWGCCSVCGAPWRRMVERSVEAYNEREGIAQALRNAGATNGGTAKVTLGVTDGVSTSTTGWQPTCKHEAPIERAVVLDPFMGSGTTGQVAFESGRDYAGVELNPTYAEMAKRRIGADRGRLL